MTAVKATPTTPPPRLPVRDKAAAGDRGWGGVSPMLTRLAAEEATGVLVRERGSLHLVDGGVVHAESPSAPGLDLLLTAHGTLGTEAWEAAARATDDRHATTRLLLDGGLLSPGALELCHLGALYDAAYFVLAPSSTPGRFRYGVTHPLGGVRPVPVAALERETLRRRDLLHRVWPDAATDGAPLVRADPVVPPPVTPRQAAVLARVDGVRTATDIARALGRRAYPTLLDVRRLVSAGLVSPRPAAPAAVTAPGPAPGPAHGATPVLDVVDPDITLLKRLRDALEAL
ncbi:transcriptional regulator [Streptomyces sp. NPDC058420]|uniref:transcriptional regulator n=1 Tax=Streptomyces sp. NPDC058420 TaxID=3346489 RepID=UPI003653E771